MPPAREDGLVSRTPPPPKESWYFPDPNLTGGFVCKAGVPMQVAIVQGLPQALLTKIFSKDMKVRITMEITEV